MKSMRVNQERETRFSPAAVQLKLGLALLIIGALLKVSAALAQPTLDHLQLKTPFRYDHERSMPPVRFFALVYNISLVFVTTSALVRAFSTRHGH